MNPAQAKIVAVLREQHPSAGWTASKLRVATGLDKATFQDALRVLRNTGKICFAGFDLSPSMLERDVPVLVPPPSDLVALLDGDAFLHAERCLASGRGAPLRSGEAMALLQAIEGWCARNLVAETRVGEWLFRHAGFVALLRKRLTVRSVPALMVRALMARWPDGMGDEDVAQARRVALGEEAASMQARSIAAAPARAVRPVAAAVNAEAAAIGVNRMAARVTGGGGLTRGAVDAALTGLSIGAQIQHAALSDDQLAAAQIARSQWSDLWDRLCLSAAAAGERPVQAMRRLIEAGLWVEQLDGEEEAA
ncbi:hypothetical protein MRBLMC3_002897 [Sphingobium sp. LMC3-1-1.1]|uniref:hypothetical protein n=1 Tax=Sphingobium sp. LMC3-1-1.1 TaxID=3135241 RepID=UPI0034450FB9